MKFGAFFAAIVAAGLALVGAGAAEPQAFPRETPLLLRPDPPISAKPGESFLIRGKVSGDEPAMLVLRVDDASSSSYASRVNEERLLPPGPFVWRFPLAGAKTSGGHLLDATKISRIEAFEPDRAKRILIESADLAPAETLPQGAQGFSLGAPDAPLIGGLARLAPGDPRLIGGHPVAVRRSGPDPVIGNGVAGIEKLRLDWPRGRALLSLWIEDPGEWESLPHPLQRRIRVNGADFLYRWESAGQWIARRYLAGRDREAGPGDDAWSAYGAFRGDLLSQEIEVGDEGVTIELAGEGAAATYLAAAVIEPAGQSAARDAVQSARRRFLVENFPVLPQRAAPAGPVFAASPAKSPPPLRATLARGSGARLSFAIGGGGFKGAPKITLDAPSRDGMALNLDLYARQPQLRRLAAGSNLLERRIDFLRGDPESLAVGDEPRDYLAWALAPDEAPAGVYRGAIRFEIGDQKLAVPLEIEVLDVALPAPAHPAGFYLDEAPHLAWFDATRAQRGRQIGCDFAALSAFGVMGDAPPLSTPDREGLAGFLADETQAAQARLAEPWLAYAPLKRLFAEEGAAVAAEDIFRAEQALALKKLPAPVWALFDEPSNVAGGAEGALKDAAILRAKNPNLRLAGQFNSPGDWAYLDSIDVAIVNPGFGVDAETLERVKARGKEAWIYNTGAPRLTAGLWLWRTQAQRYLQWHARMPTADPFDPTDGREGDVQVFPPAPQVCAARPDIDISLIEMAEGLVDQRWLNWLSARPEPKARALAAQIASEIPRDWASAEKKDAEFPARIRAGIIELARSLN